MKSIIILCGGMSRRMGRDKGSMILYGKPLVLHLIERLSPVVDEIILVLRDDEHLEKYGSILKESKTLKTSDILICTDVLKDQGPLAGILTGLNKINSSKALIIPCDSPCISESFVNNMFEFSEISNFDAYVPKWSDDKLEPLHAIYNKKSVPIINKLLEDDVRDVKTLISQLNVEYIDAGLVDESGMNFFNLNRIKDISKLSKD